MLVRKVKGNPRDFEADVCGSLYLSNHMHFITNGYKRFSKTKATCSFKSKLAYNKWCFLSLLNSVSSLCHTSCECACHVNFVIQNQKRWAVLNSSVPFPANTELCCQIRFTQSIRRKYESGFKYNLISICVFNRYTRNILGMFPLDS